MSSIRHFLSLKNKPFIIAEMSGNHNQSLERALAIVDAAVEAGAHAVKLQTYTADTMTLPLRTKDFIVEEPKSLWKGRALYDLYQEAQTPWEWHKAIFDRCRDKGVFCFSTPFDESAVDFLESLEVPFYKIASFELTDLPLIKRVANTGKPLIMSCGMATAGEIETAVRVARNAGTGPIALLKCTSSYPASPENTNISTIPHMSQMFQTEVGLSDHTMGIGVAVASIALGATIIEKHFTLSRAEGGIDSAFSLEPSEFKALVIESERAWQSIGHVHYGPTTQDLASLRYRRSIYVTKTIRKGEAFSKENVRIVRPGFGLPPSEFETVLSRYASRDLEQGTALSQDDLTSHHVSLL